MALATKMAKNVTLSQVLDAKSSQLVTNHTLVRRKRYANPGCVISTSTKLDNVQLDNVQSICYNACLENTFAPIPLIY